MLAGITGMRLSINQCKLVSIECRVKRNQKSFAYEGYEYRVYVRLKLRGTEVFYEWIIAGDPNSDDPNSLDFVSSSVVEEDDVYKIEHQCTIDHGRNDES